MKKSSPQTKFILLLSISLVFIHCSSSGPKRASLDPASQKFLDVISYIILPVEEKIYREMPPEDRGEFVKDFWARRDTDPSTPENEFRSTYYTRMAVADKAFGKGIPGWKTDRGRIFVLFGPPTNILSKFMGDVPYEIGQSMKANPIETGTITERPTEIWVYDNYPEYFSGPLRLVFVDYSSTGEYKLTTKLEHTPLSMIAETWDQPNLSKYQWVGEIIDDQSKNKGIGIFDYDAAVNVVKDRTVEKLNVKVVIPLVRLQFRQDEEEKKYTAEALISVEWYDAQQNLLDRLEESVRLTLDGDQLRQAYGGNRDIRREWTIDLSPDTIRVYVSVTDGVREKRLRKLFVIGNS